MSVAVTSTLNVYVMAVFSSLVYLIINMMLPNPCPDLQIKKMVRDVERRGEGLLLLKMTPR